MLIWKVISVSDPLLEKILNTLEVEKWTIFGIFKFSDNEWRIIVNKKSNK